MPSNFTDSSKSTKLPGEQMSGDLGLLTCKINQLKTQIQEERVLSIKERIEKNKKKLQSDVSQLSSLATSRSDDSSTNNMLSSRIKNPLCLLTGQDQRSRDNNNTRDEEVTIRVTAKLPFVEKIPPYTTWTFLNRNQRMTEDESVIGKRRIYYNQHGGEAMICSDSDEQIAEPPAQEKHEFSEAEKRIIRMVCQDYEPNEEVLKILTKFVGGTISEILEVYNMVEKKDAESSNQNVSGLSEVKRRMNELLDKSLVASLDSYDTLFCRRCLIFDCRLHGCSQTVINPTERQEDPFESKQDGKPCGNHCYLQASIQAQGSPRICQWKTLEKDLFLKGLEMFGQNSCLIARNLLPGLKKCVEIYAYMHDTVCPTLDNDRSSNTDLEDEQEVPSRSRSLRRKGRARKLKFSWKPSRHPSLWRGIADGKNESCKQYTPCECKSMCGTGCPCVDNSTCCEKSCGCSKSCKNRFRGCHCAKSQCRTRQCPCFAAGRECDPDVCRNCWVSCGDGSLGEPPKKGEGESQCGNMRLLLMQHQRVLLGKSDVAGWGAFLMNSANKGDYLGEYTGELISHYEADIRGKLYDRANSSFLFNVNDEYVLDACRKGNKLKFANHSSEPNCQAKIIQAAGEHRVAIFAKEPIEAGEELFYDYCYAPEQAPPWARKPDASASKGECSYAPQGQPKKH